MTNYLVRENGRRTIIDDDIFNMIWQSIDEDDRLLTTVGCYASKSSQTPGEFSTETEESSTSTNDSRKIKKKQYNDTLNKKYKENGYFKEYYKEHDKPFECENCGCKLNSSTNRARHQKTKKCIVRGEEIRQKELEEHIIKKVIGIPT